MRNPYTKTRQSFPEGTFCTILITGQTAPPPASNCPCRQWRDNGANVVFSPHFAVFVALCVCRVGPWSCTPPPLPPHLAAASFQELLMQSSGARPDPSCVPAVLEFLSVAADTLCCDGGRPEEVKLSRSCWTPWPLAESLTLWNHSLPRASGSLVAVWLVEQRHLIGLDGSRGAHRGRNRLLREIVDSNKVLHTHPVHKGGKSTHFLYLEKVWILCTYIVL